MKFFTILAGLALTVPIFAQEAKEEDKQNKNAENALAEQLGEQLGNGTAVNLGNGTEVNLGEDLGNINIDPNNVEGSLENNIGELMLSMGVCNFNSQLLSGLGVGNQIQLLLQLQQLQQLQQLGLINNVGVNQIIQQNLLNNFGLGGISLFGRSVNEAVRKNIVIKKRGAYRKRSSCGARKA